MNAVEIVLAVAIVAAAVLFVCLPYLREPETDDDRLDAPTEGESRRLALAEERDRALAALKELEFDHRTGTVSDDDYRALVGPLRRDAASALQALERGTAPSEGPLGRDDRPASEPRRDETGSGAPAGRDGDVGVRHRGPGGG